jgi:hypothetical protein
VVVTVGELGAEEDSFKATMIPAGFWRAAADDAELARCLLDIMEVTDCDEFDVFMPRFTEGGEETEFDGLVRMESLLLEAAVGSPTSDELLNKERDEPEKRSEAKSEFSIRIRGDS